MNPFYLLNNALLSIQYLIRDVFENITMKYLKYNLNI